MDDNIRFTLSKEFVSKYSDKRPNWGPAGEFTYYRTYSRWLSKERRREYWYEACERVINYKFSILLQHLTKNNINIHHDELVKQAKQSFDDMFYLRVLPSGRTMWIGGSEAAWQCPLANYNCAFQIIQDREDFCDLFYLLMVGAGVGSRILYSDIKKVARFKGYEQTEIKHKPYNAIPKHERTDKTFYHSNGNSLTIVIGDSKEGWVAALSRYLSAMTDGHYDSIEFIYDNVRPKGERLKKFGGRASGHDSLKQMFTKIHRVITRMENGLLKPIDALDICNIIGQNVVVGGVRRTAENLLIDVDDIASIEAKRGAFWEDPDKAHRNMSNNSIIATKKPTKKQFDDIFTGIKQTAEPNFLNLSAARLRWHEVEGVNPCVSGDTVIDTDKGPKQVRELLDDNDFSVLVHGKYYRATPFKFTGTKEVYLITTSSGNRLKVTGNHLILVPFEDGNLIWKRVDTLVPNKDKIVLNDQEGSFSLVLSIEKQTELEDVYDCGVQDAQMFSANGIVVHNCFEILLRNKGLCNLSTINVNNYVLGDNKLDIDGLKQAVKGAAEHCLQITLIDLELPAWDKVQKEDRLLGVSMTGWQDAIHRVGWHLPEFRSNRRALLKELKSVAREYANERADQLKIPRPKLVTTLKPEGTSSQLMGVSSGGHWQWDKYFIRRIRISSNDPLLEVMRREGYHCEPVDGTEETATTWCIEFYCHADTDRTSNAVSAIEQLENYIDFQECWTEHNASNTITVGDDEWDDVQQWVSDNWDNFVAVSFLSKVNITYPQAPYESINEEVYREKVKQMKPFDVSILHKIEDHEYIEYDMESMKDPSCVGGACPIR